MDEMKQYLENYSEKLSDRIDLLRHFELTDDDRTLRCRQRGGRTFMSVRSSRKDGRKEHYIPDDDLKDYRRLARKAYARKMLPQLERDQDAIDAFLSGFSWQEERILADSMDPKLITLCGKGFDSKTTFAEKWISQTWTEHPILGDPPDRPVISGHVVRSKSEEFIDNALFNHGLLFFYEKPLYLPGMKYPVFPDFTILDLRTLEEVYWEHLGRMDDPAYADANCKKLMELMRCGLYPGPRLILTFETSEHPLSSLDVEMIIQKYFLKQTV